MKMHGIKYKYENSWNKYACIHNICFSVCVQVPENFVCEAPVVKSKFCARLLVQAKEKSKELNKESIKNIDECRKCIWFWIPTIEIQITETTKWKFFQVIL